MRERIHTIARTVKQPEYTGENRCRPCTALNAAIAVAAAVTVGTVSVPLSVVVLAVAATTIYLRGYIVPGTPTLTARYLPDAVGRRFGHEGSPVTDGGELTEAERRFLEAGVLVDEAAGELTLDPDFAADWLERARDLRGDEAAQQRALADVFEVDPDATEISVIDPVCFGKVDGTQVGQWPSRAALVADVTADPELAARIPDWEALDFEERGVLLQSLRVFLETCPTCGGDVDLDAEREPDCCGGTRERFSMECSGCGAPLL